ncbi:MAG: 30S ribosomal protein S18 [Bdellovibrionota bacterium]
MDNKDSKNPTREEFESKDFDASSKDGPRGGRSFNRRKVCPFVADKNLILDYKNLKVLQRFTSESGKIVPRYVSGVSAKNQRKLTKMVKRARNVGFIAPLVEAQA